MVLIFGEADLRKQFQFRWMTKYVPAILQYGEKSTKRNVVKQLAELDRTGTCFILSFGILCMSYYLTFNLGENFLEKFILSKG